MKRKHVMSVWVFVVPMVLSGLLIVTLGTGCGGSKDENAMAVKGAGATFPEPIYVRWAQRYQELNKGTTIEYAGIGSSGGIKNIKEKTVDFGGSDAPLTGEELEEAGLVQFPMVIGGVVPIYNLKGVGPGELRLTGKVLADIYEGKITRWDDADIKELNPDVALPAEEITPVVRADGSGTTWIFTNYLSKVSSSFAQNVGNDKKPGWSSLAGKGNAGVASNVQKIENTIGYVEFAYALQNKLPAAKMQNRAGKWVDPTSDSFSAAAEKADWAGAKGYYVILTDQSGDETWPIVGATFILMHKNQENAAKAKALLGFFDWCYQHGAEDAMQLHFVPIPKAVYEMVEKTWSAELKSDGQPVWGQ